jgi:hypothetical protein
VKTRLTRFASVPYKRRNNCMKNGEKGQALLIVLALVAFGGLVISPFLGQAGSSLTGSRLYADAISQQYSSDAGVEHAIWGLRFGSLDNDIPETGNTTTYQLGETINGYTPEITATNMGSSVYDIVSVAGDETITVTIDLSKNRVDVLEWNLNQ